MQLNTTPARWLARVAGAISGLAAIYVLTQDAVHSGHWTTDDLLMPVLVLLTILAAHLFGSAIRARAWLSVAGFTLLAIIGTSLIVYTSVGRQARIADTEDGAAAAAQSRIAAVNAEIAHSAKKRGEAEAMLEEAQGNLAVECKNGNGKNCKGIKATIDVYEAAIKGHDSDLARLRGDLAKIGPPPVTGAKASRMAAVVAVFFADEDAVKARLTRVFRLFEPFAYSIFWELGSLICFGFGFGHGRRLPTASDTAQTSFAGNDSQPEPPNGGNRFRKPLPANVVPLATVSGKHPVIAALENAGGSVASNRQLARLMGVTAGEASKRVAEVAASVEIERVGKEKRIRLRARRAA